MVNCSKAAKQEAVAIAKGNSTLQEAEQALNSAESSTIGLTIAQTALNAVIGLGVGLLINLAVKGISKVINYQQDLIDKSEEAISAFEESRDSLSNNKQTIDNISSDYAKLAQGVDSLGRNISLNTEEYSRYNEIVNKIADMFPQMVQGYTDEGNAIIANKGNVEELTRAYEEQKKAYQDLVITKSAETFDGYKAKVVETSLPEKLKGKRGTYAYSEQKKYIDELIESLEKGQEAFEDFYSNQYIGNSDIYSVLYSATKTAGIDWGGIMNTDERYDQIKTQMTKLYAYQRQLVSNINTETAKIKPIMSAYLEQSYDYQSLDSNVQDVVSQIIGQFDSEFYMQFDNETDMASWVTENIVNKFKGVDGKKVADAFKNAINLKTKLQNGEISLDEYLSAISEFKTLIDGFDNSTKKSVELIFNVNSSNGLSTDTMVNNVKDKLQDEFDDKVGTLTIDDLEIAANLEIPEGTLLTWDELISKIKEVQSSTLNNETDISYTEQLSQVQALSKGLDQLGKIYTDVQNKEDFDWSSILNNKDFEETFGNMQNVNGEYKNAYEDFIQTVSNSPNDINACQTAFDNLATAYINNSGVLDNLTEETKASTIAMLEQMGIANADEVVTAKLAAQELKLKLNMEGTTDEISKQISDLINHGEASGIAASALFDLVTQVKVFNTTGLSVTDRVKELEKLATAFGIATDSASDYWTVERQLAYAKSKGISEEQFLANTTSKYQNAIQEKFGSISAKYTSGLTTNKNSGSSSSSKDTKQPIDWISRKFDILAKQLDVIKKKASEVYSTFKNQNKQLDLAIENIESQITLYKKAYTAYMKQADSVGLSASLKKKVQNGSMNVSEYSGTIADKIQEYQKYYDLAQDTLKTITELKLEEKELASQKLSNITDDYDRKKSYQEALANLREAKAGDNLTEKDYNYLIKKQNHIKANLQKEQKALEDEFNALVKNGTIKKYSDAWYEWKEKIVGVKVEIEDCNNEIEDLAENIIDIRWEKFDKAIEKLDTIGDKLSKIKNFFDGDLFDGTSITKTGLANVALGFADMANEKQKLVNYQAEKNRLNTMLSDNNLTSAEREKYEKRLKEIEKLEIESALNIKNARQSIIDIYIQSIEEETKAMEDLTTAKKSELQAEVALHNYRSKIADKEEDIAILQKKIAELSKSTDRKDIAMRLELEEELKEAKEDLAEEQYQHDIDQQQEALDEELSDFEKMQDQKIKDVKNNLDTQEKILNKYFSDVKSGWTTMIDYMRGYGNQFGVDMTSTLTNLLESAKSLTEFMDINPNVDYSTKHVNKNQTDIPIRDIGIGAVVGAGTAIVSGSGNSSTGKKKDTSGDKDVVSKEKASTLPGTIKYGDSGKNVTVLQKALKALGFSVGSTGVDGKFGSNTLAAVKSFQKSTKVRGGVITADGIVGTNTKKKFKANNYRKGVKDLKENQLALTQEDGTEIVLRPSEGILTPLQKGDSVLTSAQTDNLIALSKMTPVDMSKLWNINTNIPSFSNIQTKESPVVIEHLDASVNLSGITRDEINKTILEECNKVPDKIAKAVYRGGYNR
ncbi:peptidoglycan-binding protein [Acetivibrio ethanolgignens]|uniref:Peptidoglycan binding-like domain-containing protein n=1 Tax=Acetivibrio ethanolgignens TaxID=290052 RepID=A0A0V8QGR9_9FIRM|nr:peptidoglycan-binding protein [Acetivibrio ethanolgignens]KSV59289.1 hypothetical protein ASU35_09440 [Acetivibrio ethanolgignens]